MEGVVWWKFITVMIALAITDVFWTYYIQAVGENKAFKAGFSAALIMVFGAVSVINYTQNHWYLVAGVIGSFIGTYATVWYNKRKQEKEGEKE